MRKLLSLAGKSATYILGYAIGSLGFFWALIVGVFEQSLWALAGVPVFCAGVALCVWAED